MPVRRSQTSTFDETKYPASHFKVTQRNFPFGDLSIKVAQTKVRNTSEGSNPSYCRAWVEVSRAGNTLKQLYYPDFEPVGSSYGIFVPKKQPFENYFVLLKLGDYDGRLLIVNKDGTVRDLDGGFYFVTRDRRYLISEWSSDDVNLLVFDSTLDRVVLNTRKLPYIQQWYQDSKGYFFTESEWDNGPVPHAKPRVAYRLDLVQYKVVKFAVAEEDLKAARPVAYEFDPRNLEDCTTPMH